MIVPTIETSTTSQPLRHPPLSKGFFNPLNLLWIAVLPHALLLAYNCHVAWLVFGPERKFSLLTWIGLVAGLLVAQTGFTGFLCKRKTDLDWKYFLGLLVAQGIGVWMNLHLLSNVNLSTVPEWILDVETVYYLQLMAMIPLCFYAAIGTASFPSRWSFWKEMGMSLLGIVITPALLYTLGLVSSQFNHFKWGSSFFYVALPVILLTGTSLLFIFLLRLLIQLHDRLQQRTALLITLAAFVFPIGGLVLNSYFPFPWNFQSTTIYILCGINALILGIGAIDRFHGNRWIWLAQCASFPFTLYFFLIFLPFLPLTIPGILAFGGGVLILAPTILFMVHGRTILDGFRLESKRSNWKTALAMALVASVLMPSFFINRAHADRTAVHQALDYVYSPQLHPRVGFHGDLSSIQRSLESLRDFKEGIYLPIVSDYYQQTVFNRLVLPDEKLKHLYETIVGVELPPASKDTLNGIGLFRESNRSRNRTRGRAIPLPREQAIIQDWKATPIVEGDFVRLKLHLFIKNNASVQNEFVTQISVPEPTLISGYWLKIGDAMVPGRIFEKKTALWVYEQIRDRERRDPGLLRYLHRDQVELRIFPLASGETRETEIEFLFPKSLAPKIQSDQILFTSLLSDSETAHTPVIEEFEFSPGKTMISGAAHPSLPTLSQIGYPHFIVDRSKSSSLKSSSEILTLLKKTAKAAGFEESAGFKLTFANLQSNPASDRVLSWSEAESKIKELLFKMEPQGGFDYSRALKEEILEHESGWTSQNQESFLRFPVFILLSEKAISTPLPQDPSEEIGDLSYPLLHSNRSTLDASPINLTPNRVPALSREVRVFARGSEVKILSVSSKGENSIGATTFHQGPEVPLLVFQPTLKQFVECQASLKTHPLFEKGLALWNQQRETDKSPQLLEKNLPHLVNLSRESGILIPATSYIVVENEMQWKTLRLKENQKLEESPELEFQESPEPGLCFLLIGGLLIVAWRRRTELTQRLKSFRR